ncbi:MAG TPA: ABC transporter permease [Candidatus Cybelea sp.]|nr:ABC transporter permease [Candidatus Cybelea sp.]
MAEMAATNIDARNVPPTPAELAAMAGARAALKRRRILVNAYRIAFLVLILGGWELGARLGWIDPFFFAMPTTIAAQIWDWIVEGTSQGPLWQQILVTLEETVIGFLIGAVFGIAAGLVLGRDKLLADIFSIYIKIANSVPRVVLGSIFVIALGLGMASKVALAVVMVFFVVFGNAFQGVREADRNLISNARILGASKRQVMFSVVVPSALTWITASLHVSFGFALVGAVVGEFLGSRQGLGLLIATAQGTFNAAGVFAAMIVLAVVALIAEGLITLLENRLVKWRPAQLADAGF